MNPLTPSILLTGGGTGGHVAPGIAIAEHIEATGGRVLLLGTGRGAERNVVEASSISYRTLGPHFNRAGGLGRGLLAARTVIQRFRPDLVIGLGGYGQVPGILGAAMCRIPYVLIEQNAVCGRANRWLTPGARAIFVPWNRSTRSLGVGAHRACVIPTPVRRLVLDAPGRQETRKHLGLEEHQPVLLVLGGSQGSSPLNQFMTEQAAPQLARRNVAVLHLAGSADATQVESAYRRAGVTARVWAFHNDVGALMKTADLALSRAGGGTIAELLALGLPSFLVPYPFAKDNHQAANARCAARTGAAWVVDEEALKRMGTPLLMGQLERLSQSGSSQPHPLRQRASGAIWELCRPFLRRRALRRAG